MIKRIQHDKICHMAPHPEILISARGPLGIFLPKFNWYWKEAFYILDRWSKYIPCNDTDQKGLQLKAFFKKATKINLN